MPHTGTTEFDDTEAGLAFIRLNKYEQYRFIVWSNERWFRDRRAEFGIEPESPDVS